MDTPIGEAGRTSSRLARRVAELEKEIERLGVRLEETEERAERLADQLAEKEETIAQIFSSKIYRLTHTLWRAADTVLVPMRRALGPRTHQLPRSSTGGSLRAELPPARSFDVFCLPVIDWEFRFQRPQQLLREFARDGHRVFYLRTAFHQEGRAAKCRRIMPGVVGVTLPSPQRLNLYRDVLTPQALSAFVTAIAELRRRERIHEAVVVVHLPFWAPLANALRDRWGWRVVYDCMDEHAGFATNTSHMVATEDDLLRDSDLVVTTARLLTEKARRVTDSVLEVPNAGDLEHFQHGDPHEMFRELKRPVIGYYGAISHWFDVAMIAEAAAARPDWTFVLIGHTDGADVGVFSRLPNVRLLGEVPYSELPCYLHGFDVACIPFLDNELTRATNPVKFFEYLAAGKPVVAVELNELHPFREFFYAATDAGEFVRAAERALAEDDEQRAGRRREFAAQHTWRRRYEVLEGAIRTGFGKVAIIVVSYQNPDYMRQCLESILGKTAYPNFEVIVVDNASNRDVVDYLVNAAAADPRIRLILNEANHGFARANNQGIEAASDAEYLVLLNNDTIVTPGWLFGLVRYLKNPEVGMVGPVTSFAGNEAKIPVRYTDPAGIDAFAADYTARHDGLHFDIGVLAMFCVAMRREVVDRIGPLDERYGVGMFEDDDFSLRVREAGWRTVCAEDVFVHHWGEGSFGKLQRPEYRAIFESNKKKFEAKWGREWVAHSYRTWDPESPPPEIVKPFRVNGCATPQS
ncbi:MAG: glycosyltransferase [Planctomycetes bacterium]|nr:glycosyltransferase [Planctomycetota bacterium]MCB9888184.1 glycosyltransferase [Planctomycetota bacterium]